MLLLIQVDLKYIIIYFTNDPREYTSGWALVSWFILVVLSPSAVTLFDMHGKKLVDGAIDNLSGIAIATIIFYEFRDRITSFIKLIIFIFIPNCNIHIFC